MGKDLRKVVQPVLTVPSILDSEFKLYDAKIIVFAEMYKLSNQDIRKFKDANQHSYNLYKQHCAKAMLQKLTVLHEWETVEEDIGEVGLAKMLQQVCHKKGSGVNHNMLNLVQAAKDAFMCCQQRDSVRTYNELFLATLEAAEVVDSMIV